MIISVDVTNPAGETLELPLRSPEKSGLLIKNIEGLGPSSANINMREMATMDGSLFSGSKLTSRNIVMEFYPLAVPTIEHSRIKAYRFFPIKKKVTLRFKTDLRDVAIEGYVETIEPVIFSDMETIQVSIVCPNPYFYASDGSANAFFGAIPMFEFPFSNESLTENLISFGEIRIDSRAIIFYEGDIDTGVLITIHALNNGVRGIVIGNSNTNERMVFIDEKIKAITGKELSELDDIIVSTVKGNKYVKLLRNGVYYDIISALDRDSDWFQLSYGDNVFSYSAESGAEDILITFSYKVAYGGI